MLKMSNSGESRNTPLPPIQTLPDAQNEDSAGLQAELSLSCETLKAQKRLTLNIERSMIQPDTASRTLIVEVKESETVADTYIASGTIAGKWKSEIAKTAKEAAEKVIAAYEEESGHKYKRVKIQTGVPIEHPQY